MMMMMKKKKKKKKKKKGENVWRYDQEGEVICFLL